MPDIDQVNQNFIIYCFHHDKVDCLLAFDVVISNFFAAVTCFEINLHVTGLVWKMIRTILRVQCMRDLCKFYSERILSWHACLI